MAPNAHFQNVTAKPASLAFLLTLGTALVGLGQNTDRPNFVLIFADDLGYGDLAPSSIPSYKAG